ncbi:MAG: Wzz/FepE/Etk N-terminal domain-containing protein [Bacteroidota bacterium]
MEQKDLQGLIRPLKKNWLFILSMLITGVFLAHNIYTYQRPLYESHSLIKLDDTYSGFSDNNLYQDLDIFAENNDIATEVEVLKSDTILKKALQKLSPIEYHRIGSLMKMDIYKDHPFHLTYDSLSFRDFDQLFFVEILDEKNFRIEKGEKFLKGQFDKGLLFEGNAMKLEFSESWIRKHGAIHLPGRYSFRVCSDEYLLQNFVNGNLLVKEVKEHVRVIRINFEGRNAKRVADFTNAVANSYLEDHISHKMAAADLTEEFLDKRIQETARRLNAAERALESFRLNNKVLNLSQETETDLRKISQLEIQQTNLNMKLVVLDSLIKYVQLDREKFLQLAPSYESYGGLLFTELVKQLKGLEEEKIELERKYAKGSDELWTVDQKISKLVNYIQENIHNHRKNSYAQLDKIEKDINGEKKSLESIPTVEKNLKRLERDFNNYQELYNFLTKKQLEAGIAKRAKLYFHRILSKAKIATSPNNPSRWFLMVFAAFIALLLSVFILYLRDFLQAKIWEAEPLIEHFSSASMMLEDRGRRDLEADIGLRLASRLKKQNESSTFLAICPSNSSLSYSQQLRACTEALLASGEKILCLYWDPKVEIPSSSESRLIKSYLKAEKGSAKLKSLLKGSKVLHERMYQGPGEIQLMSSDEGKRFRELNKYFDRIILFLPAPSQSSLFEILSPLYDGMLCLFQRGISRKKELSFFLPIPEEQRQMKIVLLLDERKRSFKNLQIWVQSLWYSLRPRQIQKSLSA